MIIKFIQGADHIYNAPPDWSGKDMTCDALPVRHVSTPDGQFLVSAWEPTPEELGAMQRGETVKLWIRGEDHPVVALTVGDVEPHRRRDRE